MGQTVLVDTRGGPERDTDMATVRAKMRENAEKEVLEMTGISTKKTVGAMLWTKREVGIRASN